MSFASIPLPAEFCRKWSSRLAVTPIGYPTPRFSFNIHGSSYTSAASACSRAVLLPTKFSCCPSPPLRAFDCWTLRSAFLSRLVFLRWTLYCSLQTDFTSACSLDCPFPVTAMVANRVISSMFLVRASVSEHEQCLCLSALDAVLLSC